MRVLEQFASSSLASKGSNGGWWSGHEIPHAAYPQRYRVIVEYSKPNKKIVSREKNKLLKLVIYASFNDLLCIFAQWKIIQAEKNT